MIFFLSDPISTVVFGEKWKGIELVIGVMALMHGFSWILSGANGEVYRGYRAVSRRMKRSSVPADLRAVYSWLHYQYRLQL